MERVWNFKKDQKAFTLVEIIVVLVILAILAAVGIPSMIGFIDDARGKAYIAEARAAYVACQMAATERYAVEGESGDFTVPKAGCTDADYESSNKNEAGKVKVAKRVRELLGSDVPGKINTFVKEGKVETLTYVAYKGNQWYYKVEMKFNSNPSTVTITKN